MAGQPVNDLSLKKEKEELKTNKQNINQLIIHPELKKEKKNIVKTRCEEKFLIIGRLKLATDCGA